MTSWYQDVTPRWSSTQSVYGRYSFSCSSRVKLSVRSLASGAGQGYPSAFASVEPFKGVSNIHLLSFEYAGGQTFVSGCLHKLVSSCAERDSRDPLHQDQAAPTRYSSHPSMPMPCPAPRPVKYPSQWRVPAAAAASHPPHEGGQLLHRQDVREQPAERPAAEQPQPIQEEGSGYMSTESDSDTGTNDKALVWHLDAYFNCSVTRCCC